MRRKMVEIYRHIDQLIEVRVYLGDLKEHISRIEALTLQNDGINGDGDLSYTIESTETTRGIRMGYFQPQLDERKCVGDGVRTRRQNKMGRLERA